MCRKCKTKVPAKGGNTSNLLTHLRDHHPDLYSEAVPSCSRGTKRQATIKEVCDKGKMYESKSSRAQELNRAVAFYLAKDTQSLYTVEKPGFKHSVSKVDPKYSLPSGKYFTKQEIPRLYAEIRDGIVKPTISEVKYFAATSDVWTSCANHPYLSYTQGLKLWLVTAKKLVVFWLWLLE